MPRPALHRAIAEAAARASRLEAGRNLPSLFVLVLACTGDGVAASN